MGRYPVRAFKAAAERQAKNLSAPMRLQWPGRIRVPAKERVRRNEGIAGERACGKSTTW